MPLPCACHRCGLDLETAPAPRHPVGRYVYCEPCALIVADRVDRQLARMIRASIARRAKWARHFAPPPGEVAAP